MYSSLPFSAKYNVCCKLLAPQCLLELSLKLQMFGFKKSLSVSTTLSNIVMRRWGHFVILPEQVSLADLCGKQQVVSLLSRNFSSAECTEKYPPLIHQHWKPFPNSDPSDIFLFRFEVVPGRKSLFSTQNETRKKVSVNFPSGCTLKWQEIFAGKQQRFRRCGKNDNNFTI